MSQVIKIPGFVADASHQSKVGRVWRTGHKMNESCELAIFLMCLTDAVINIDFLLCGVAPLNRQMACNIRSIRVIINII